LVHQRAVGAQTSRPGNGGMKGEPFETILIGPRGPEKPRGGNDRLLAREVDWWTSFIKSPAEALGGPGHKTLLLSGSRASVKG